MRDAHSIRAGIVLVFVVPFVIGACAPGDRPPAAPVPAPPAAAAPATGLTLVAGRATRGAVVTLEPATPREFPLPGGPAVLDQYSKQFVPGVLVARVGQPVEFRNSEDTPHNVNVVRTPAGAQIFSVSTDPFQKHVHTFEREGRYNVTCDIHPGMQATVVVTVTPYVTLADDTGAFQIADVEPGSYVLRVAGAGGNSERRIEVSGARVDVG